MNNVSDYYPGKVVDDEITIADLDMTSCYPNSASFGNWDDTIERTVNKDHNSRLYATSDDTLIYYFTKPEFISYIACMAYPTATCPPSAIEIETIMKTVIIYYADGTQSPTYNQVTNVYPLSKPIVRIVIGIYGTTSVSECIMKRDEPKSWLSINVTGVNSEQTVVNRPCRLKQIVIGAGNTAATLLVKDNATTIGTYSAINAPVTILFLKNIETSLKITPSDTAVNITVFYL
jgi:hypothetical protein